jgi:hypothetical protein
LTAVAKVRSGSLNFVPTLISPAGSLNLPTNDLFNSLIILEPTVPNEPALNPVFIKLLLNTSIIQILLRSS